MAGPRLYHKRKKDVVERSPPFERRRLSGFKRFFWAAVTGIFTLSGTNINHAWGNQNMPQPIQRRAPAVEKKFLMQRATDAANAFRDYVVSGDESRRDLFWSIYKQEFKEKPLYENKVFMGRLSDEMDRVKKDPQVRRLWEAFREGIPTMQPAVMNDFIDDVHKIRGLLQRAASYKMVMSLVDKVEAAKGRPVRADSDIAKVRELIESGVLIQDAAKMVLERPAIEKAVALNEVLTGALLETRPREQGRLGVEAFRDFILTGDERRRNEFQRIWDANTGDAFLNAFAEYFRSRITADRPSGLADVLAAYKEKYKRIDPMAFAKAVTEIYRTATEGTAEGMDKMRAVHGKDVVDPLLKIAAKGMAHRAIASMRRLIETGDPKAGDEFLRVYRGNFLGKPIEQDDVFWNEFAGLYLEVIKGTRVAASFGREILPIAIRDIYTELAKKKPDMKRLEGEYGKELVAFIVSNSANLRWLVKSPPTLHNEINRRVRMRDPLAKQLRDMSIKTPKGLALADAYSVLFDLKVKSRAVEAFDIIDKNFEELSWLSGLPEEIQNDIERRTKGRKPEEVAADLKRIFPEETGKKLSEAYGKVMALRKLREPLVELYGKEFVDFVSEKLESLHWAALPARDIQHRLIKQMDDETIMQIHRLVGHTYGTFAFALRDIYVELGKDAPNRERLDNVHGGDLVELVAANRSQLIWLSKDVRSIYIELQKRDDELTRRLKSGRLYSYTPVQLVSALTRATQAAKREGLLLSEARDALGTIVGQVRVWKKPLLGKDVLAKKRMVESTMRHIATYIDDLNEQLDVGIMAPARVLLAERIREWTEENERIGLESRITHDLASLERLSEDQKALMKSMLSPDELRMAVELAFSSVHLAETGGDLYRFSGLPGTVTTEVDKGTVDEILAKYDRDLTGRQVAFEEVVASVMQRADPELYEFVASMNKRGLFSALRRTYDLTLGRGKREDLVRSYGELFVSMVEQQAENLRFLESGAANMRDLRQGENVLFAAIVRRCYNAISTGKEEDRKSVVRLFGKGFVDVVEKYAKELSPLATPEAGLEEVKKLPREVRRSLLSAYAPVHRKTITSLKRAYNRQESNLFYALSATYEALRMKEGVEAVESIYGKSLVGLARKNMKKLSAARGNFARLEPALLESFRIAFEEGLGPKRANFMENLKYVTGRIPKAYLSIRNSLIYHNATEELARNFGNALQIYRDELGDNDYLFKQYMNLEILSDALLVMSERYNIPLPPAIEKGIDSPEKLRVLLASPEGKRLVQAGREAYKQIENQYLLQRQQTNFNPEIGEFTDAAIQNLHNELTIIDALYMGIAVEKISGASSSFQMSASTALMNTALEISHRDPYLLGPFLLQVLPAILEVSQDERTLEMGMATFRGEFTARYQEGQREWSYSNAINRRYFMDIFARVGEELPKITSTFDVHKLEDELRLVPEPMTDQSYLNPLLYRYRRGWWHFRERRIPLSYAQESMPLSLLPQYTRPLNPYLPVPGGFALDSGALGLYSYMADTVVPPAERMFRMGVPPRYRVGAVGASTITRAISKLFGPMPVDYQAYWLSGFAEAGAFFTGGGERDVEEGEAETTRLTYGGAGIGIGRAVTGAARGRAQYRAEEVTTKIPVVEGEEEKEITAKEKAIDIETYAMSLPFPMIDNENVGIHRVKQDFHYESATGTRVAPLEGELKEITVGEKTKGLLDTYMRIASGETGENPVDMLVYVAGEHVPELRGLPMMLLSESDLTDMGVENLDQVDLPRLNGLIRTMKTAEEAVDREAAEQEVTGILEGLGLTIKDVERQTSEVIQEEYGRLKSRLYFVTKEGNVYQVACGRNTRTQLLNYLYAGANTDNVIASLKFLGKEFLTAEAALAGFDGAAVGFTIPTGAGDTVSALGFGELVRNLQSMDPVHAEEAAGLAVTRLLKSHRQRDVYASFYRGAQVVEVDPDNPTKITDSKWAEATGEVMWRRIRVKNYPMEPSWEIRAVGGYPFTMGVRGALELPTSKDITWGLGGAVSYTSIDLLRDYRVVEAQADEMYAKTSSMLVDLYGWSEDKAKNAGFLVAANYMYGKLEDWIGENKPEESPSSHYGSLLMMYWAKRHRMLAGAGVRPAYMDIYSRIERAMVEIQQNPEREEVVLTSLAKALKEEFKKDRWRFTFGYGYDGESVRAYAIGSGEYAGDERSYGNIYGLFLFGKPTKVFADILGHAYTFAPLVIQEGPAGEALTLRNPMLPYLDLYAGTGYLAYPDTLIRRYETEATVERKVDVVDALRDVYREMGGSVYTGDRVARLYGRGFAKLVEEKSENLGWMIRTEDEVVQELRKREEEDPLARNILITTVGGRVGKRTDEDFKNAAKALLHVYGEQRTAYPDVVKMEKEYSKKFVELVAGHVVDLDWVLLPPDVMKRKFRENARKPTRVEARLAGMELPKPAAQDRLTGREVQRLFEQNMEEVVFSLTEAESRFGLGVEKYDVRLGKSLAKDPKTRSGTFYVLMTEAPERPESKGSFFIGNNTDYEEWLGHNYYLGRGVARLEVKRKGDDYLFVFSGDRGLHLFSAGKVIGGLTLPLTAEAYDGYKMKGSWTVGGLLRVLQDHQNDWLAGALFGVRHFGDVKWKQITVTNSLMHRLADSLEYTDEVSWYVFFNRITREVTLASEDVFSDKEELADVCERLGGCKDLWDFKRTTGGGGITWASANIVAGKRVGLHFFFEGGLEELREWRGVTGEDIFAEIKEQRDFVFRSGFGLSWMSIPEGRAEGPRWSFLVTGERGRWPLMQGEITRPELLKPWVEDLKGAPMTWWLMVYGQLKW